VPSSSIASSTSTLSGETQVVVITHNRGTIEIADTLYGVSMGDDGVSQILSLRLADAVAQAREG
jgi:chromosome segregation protein